MLALLKKSKFNRIQTKTKLKSNQNQTLSSHKSGKCKRISSGSASAAKMINSAIPRFKVLVAKFQISFRKSFFHFVFENETSIKSFRKSNKKNFYLHLLLFSVACNLLPVE